MQIETAGKLLSLFKSIGSKLITIELFKLSFNMYLNSIIITTNEMIKIQIQKILKL